MARTVIADHQLDLVDRPLHTNIHLRLHPHLHMAQPLMYKIQQQFLNNTIQLIMLAMITQLHNQFLPSLRIPNNLHRAYVCYIFVCFRELLISTICCEMQGDGGATVYCLNLVI